MHLSDQNTEFLPACTFKLVGKNLNRGFRAPWSSMLILLLIAVVRCDCCTRKMLKETEIEEIIVHALLFLSLVSISIGMRAPSAPLVTPLILSLLHKFALTPIIKFGITKLLKKYQTALMPKRITICLKTKNKKKDLAETWMK